MLSEKNSHPNDTKIKFQDEGHKYWINGSDKDVISTTTFIHKFFSEFETDKIINNILKSEEYNNPDYKYYNMSYNNIKELWSNNSKISSDSGIKLHKDIENFYNKIEVENDSVEFKQFLDFYNEYNQNSLEIYRTEWLIYDEMLKITGSIDAVFTHPDGTLSIGDWKRSKEIKYNSYGKFGKFPLNHIPDTNYYHYSLQLNMYRKILEKFYNKKVKDMFLIVLHPDNQYGKFMKIDIPKMDDEIDLILEHRKKEIESKKQAEFIMSDTQKFAYDLCSKGNSIFLTGPGGSGKSAIIKKFYKEYRYAKNIGMTSTTGISALLIGGSTLHSYLGIGLGKDDVELLYLKIKNRKKNLKKWLELDVLIIDEVSMLSPILFDKLELLARKLRCNQLPFGGIQLILTGDMLQLPCVNSTNFCFEAKTWSVCIKPENIIYLKEIFRQDDIIFQECLNEIRVGNPSEKTIDILKTRINADLKNEHGILPTKIYSLNKDVEMENEKELDKLLLKNKDLEFFRYELTYDVLKKNMLYVEEIVKKACNAPQILEICIGAQVMLIYNIDTEMGLVNGSRGVVVNFNDGLPVVKFLNGMEMLINYNTWSVEEDGQSILNILQIPLKVAYSCSIHKIQGITLDYVELDMKNIFEDGQAYVALSRARKLEGLCIKNFDEKKIFANKKAVEFYKKLDKDIL